jgi:tetratricopeptide (TPR) repeat protein
MSLPRGVHPRLIPQAPDYRASLRILPPLAELGDDFAWAVWYSVRRACAPGPVHVPEDVRETMGSRFRAAAACVPELGEAMETLCGFACGAPADGAVADALTSVAEWAAGRGLPEPAIQCAEAAAALVPECCTRALVAGRINRLFGDPISRADVYYERAIPLARGARNWRTYVRAHVGKGHVKKSLGDPAAALAHYSTAARAARSLSGEKWLAAQTLHDLATLAAEQGDFVEAVRRAEQALENYPRHDARIPALAHDFAFVLLRMRRFGEAVALLERVMRCPMPSQEQVIGWSTLAHAAAGAGDAEGYRAASDQMLRLVGLWDLHAAAAFSNLALGAQLLRRWPEAEQYARRSLQLGEQRQQHEALPVSRDVLATLGGTHPWHVDSPVHPRVVRAVARLLPRFTARLDAWRGPSWRPRHTPRRSAARA